MSEKRSEFEKLTAVIVTFNSGQVILNCLRPLLEMGIHTVIVDNGSTDETVSLVQTYHPRATVIRNTKNSGYSRGNNAGLTMVRTPFALLLNPDVIINKAAVSHLLESFRISANVVVSVPVTYDESPRECIHRVQRKCFNLTKNAAYDVAGPHIFIRWFSGGCFMTDIQKLKSRVGFFDENIFLFWEDDDLASRISQAGLEIVMNSRAAVIHHSEQSCGTGLNIRLLRKWHDSWSFCYVYRKQNGRIRFSIKFLKLVAWSTIGLLTLKNPRSHFIRLHACFAFLVGCPAFTRNQTPESSRFFN